MGAARLSPRRPRPPASSQGPWLPKGDRALGLSERQRDAGRSVLAAGQLRLAA